MRSTSLRYTLRLALCWVSILQILPRPAYAWQLISPALHGTYRGIFVPLAKHGGSLPESALSLQVNARGLVLGAQLPGDDREWRIVYSPDWFMAPADDDPCLYVVQDVGAFDYSFRMCLDAATSARPRLRMISNRGVVLGVFTRVAPTDDDLAVSGRLKRLYESAKGAAPRVGVNRATLEFLDEMRTEFVTLDDAHLARVEPVIGHALSDPDPRVRVAALRVFAQMPTATSLRAVVDLTERADLTAEVLERATRTLGLYLETVNDILERRHALAQRFGADDLDAAHRRTRGLIAARDAAGLDLMLFGARSRAWTAEHRDLLRGALARLAQGAPDSRAQTLASDVWRVYDPAGFCDRLLETSSN